MCVSLSLPQRVKRGQASMHALTHTQASRHTHTPHDTVRVTGAIREARWIFDRALNHDKDTVNQPTGELRRRGSILKA